MIVIAIIAIIALKTRRHIVGICDQLLSFFPVLGLAEIFASLLVSIGCCGELWTVFSKGPVDEPGKQKRHLLEKIFICMVAMGVTVEVPCLTFGLRESAELNERTANTESNN